MTQLATNVVCLVADLDHYVEVTPSGYPRKNVRGQAFQTLHLFYDDSKAYDK